MHAGQRPLKLFDEERRRGRIIRVGFEASSRQQRAPEAYTIKVYTANGHLVIATLPTQEQVDEIARGLAPDVVRIRFNAGQDWSEHPAVYFRVILSDEASRGDRLADATGRVSARLFDELGLAELEHITYFRFRSQSEQAKLHDTAWD